MLTSTEPAQAAKIRAVLPTLTPFVEEKTSSKHTLVLAERVRGGHARAEALSDDRRREIASLAARARWHRPKKAHQRIIRERAALLEPREPLPSLKGCTVRRLDKATAKPIILRYEWLGTMGRPRACYGLRAPNGELLGVVTFGIPAGDESRNICGPAHRDRAIALERGACVHYAPKNAASFLIRHACKLAHREFGWSIFSSYADPSAGEVGTVYQAANWLYVGQNVGRRPGMIRRQFIKPNGKVVDERALTHARVKMSDVLGWTRVFVPSKHRYVWFE